MRWVLNPFTGQFDAADASAGWAFNPFTGALDRLGDAGGWVFNPFTGTLDSIAGAPVPPPLTDRLLWGADALVWGAGNNLIWG